MDENERMHLCKGNNNNQDKPCNTRKSKWTEETMRGAVEDFIKLYGRLPSTKELDMYSWLPPHPSIKHRYKMSAGEWLAANFPTEDIGWRHNSSKYSPEDFKRIFIKEYIRIRPTSNLMYNKNRDPLTPTWQYISKMLGVRTWVELKELTGVSAMKIRKGERTFQVVSTIKGVKDETIRS